MFVTLINKNDVVLVFVYFNWRTSGIVGTRFPVCGFSYMLNTFFVVKNSQHPGQTLPPRLNVHRSRPGLSCRPGLKLLLRFKARNVLRGGRCGSFDTKNSESRGPVATDLASSELPRDGGRVPQGRGAGRNFGTSNLFPNGLPHFLPTFFPMDFQTSADLLNGIPNFQNAAQRNPKRKLKTVKALFMGNP